MADESQENSTLNDDASTLDEDASTLNNDASTLDEDASTLNGDAPGKEVKKKDDLHFDWLWMHWALQLTASVAIVWGFANNFEENIESYRSLYGLYVVAAWMLVTFVAFIIARKGLRDLLGLVVEMVNPVLLPSLMYVCTGRLDYSLILAITYVCIGIAISPIIPGIIIYVGGALYAFVFRTYLYTGAEETPAGYVIQLCVAYMLLGGVAFLWRILLSRLSEMVRSGISSDARQQEVDVLREAIVQHIEEANLLTGFETDAADHAGEGKKEPEEEKA